MGVLVVFVLDGSVPNRLRHMLPNSVLQMLGRSTHVPAIAVAHVFIYDIFCLSWSSSFGRASTLGQHKQDWGRGFILSLPQAAVLPKSDAGSDVVKPASSFAFQNRQTSCSMWCPMYGARY